MFGINDNVVTHFLLTFSLLLKRNMDKTSEKFTKDPKRQERGKKSHGTYMKRIKKKLEYNHLPTPSPTDRPTPSTSFSTGKSTPSTPSHATRSSDTYVYGVGILTVLAIGIYVFFFAYNTSRTENKNLVNEKQDQQPKRRNMLQTHTINK